MIDHDVETLAGQPLSLADYRGKVLLLVNTASACGYTPQYSGLETLYRRFKERGFEIVGIPCNDFGAQEPGAPDEIQSFVCERYDVTFPLLAKQVIKGAGKSALYQALTEALPGEVRWNFTKFLVGKDGAVLARFEPGVEPLAPELVDAIEAALA